VTWLRGRGRGGCRDKVGETFGQDNVLCSVFAIFCPGCVLLLYGEFYLSFCLSRKISSYRRPLAPWDRFKSDLRGHFWTFSCFHILSEVDGCRNQVVTWNNSIKTGWTLKGKHCRIHLCDTVPLGVGVLCWVDAAAAGRGVPWSSWPGLLSPALGCGGIQSVERLVVSSLFALVSMIRKCQWKVSF
jgi:hypothetical protein